MMIGIRAHGLRLFKLSCDHCGFATGGFELERHVPLNQWLRFQHYLASANLRRPVELEIADSSNLQWLKAVERTVVCTCCGMAYHRISVCRSTAAYWHFVALTSPLFAAAAFIILLFRPSPLIAGLIASIFFVAAIIRYHRKHLLPNQIPNLSPKECGAVCHSCQSSNAVCLETAALEKMCLPCPVCRIASSHVVAIEPDS